MILSRLKQYIGIAAVATITFTSCEKKFSSDDPLPPEYGSTLYFSSDNKILFSYDIETRKKRWEIVADASVKASPTVYGNFVYLLSEVGTLYQIDKVTGEIVHELKLSTNTRSTPTIYNGKLIVCTSDGRMIALNANNISEEPFWTTTGLGNMSSSPTVDRFGTADTMAIVNANAGNQVFAINQEDGVILWRVNLPHAGSVVATPYASANTIFVTNTNGRVYSLRMSNGGVNWNYQTSGPVVASPSVIGGNVMFGSADMNFYSIDSTTGTPRWIVPAEDKIESSAAYDNQYVYYGSNDQNIYCVDIINGILKWKKRTFGTVRSSPVIFNKRVYAASFDQNLYIMDSETGADKGVIEVFGQMDCSPVIDNMTNVYFPPVSGNHILK